jgi:hypothetical protein
MTAEGQVKTPFFHREHYTPSQFNQIVILHPNGFEIAELACIDGCIFSPVFPQLVVKTLVILPDTGLSGITPRDKHEIDHCQDKTYWPPN